MGKAYWVVCWQKIADHDKLAAYAQLAIPAIQANGGRVLACGTAIRAYEAGTLERTVLIEFDSVAQAIAAHDSPGYRAALAALGSSAIRDIRIIAGAP